MLAVSGKPCLGSNNADVNNLPFKVGEKLGFRVYLGFIYGGNATMSVNSIEDIDGYPCYEIISEAKSTSAIDNFYKVRDRITSWQDVKGGFSRRYEKKLREGSYRSNKLVEYTPELEIALLYNGTDDECPDTLEIPGSVQDVLSALYYLRTKKLRVGESVWIDVHDINKRYNLEVEVLRKETISVPAGKFECFVIEPKLMSSGIFRREGRMQVWLSDDEYKIPVMMRSKLYFGSVWAKLEGYKLGGE
ncbi:DUF3108 domain-containing protein [bacterium]|nr:DUF3108 domain-containing protein [bacterium]